MPVEQRTTFQPLRAVLIAAAGVAMALGFMVLLLSLANTGSDVLEINLGDDAFRAGDPDNQAMVIERDGPILYADLVGKGRHIYVQHLGSDPLTGWHAFDAQRPGQSEECILQWQADRLLFTDPCDEDAFVFEAGEGQPSYPVRIDNDLLWVDLNGSSEDDDG